MSARRHSSSTVLVPPTFTANRRSRSEGRTEVTPAAWKTRSTPLSARRTARRSSTSQPTRSTSRPRISSSSDPSSTAKLTSSPRSTRSRATCEPMNPVAPVTRVFAIPFPLGDARALAVVSFEVTLAVETADRLRDRLETLARGWVPAVATDAIGALGERSPRVVDPPLLGLEKQAFRGVELLLVELARAVGGMLVDVGQLRSSHPLAGAKDRGPSAHQLREAGFQPRLDSLSLLRRQVSPPAASLDDGGERRNDRVPRACPR